MWTPEIQLDEGPLALSTRIARAVVVDIRRGRLKAGDRLPSTRSLAQRLGVHRNTVLRAYQELGAEGWIGGAARRGTRVLEGVSADLPHKHQRRANFPISPVAPLIAAPSPGPGVLNLSEGHPDLSGFPAASLARAWRRAITRHPLKLLAYGEPKGSLRLRETLCEMLSATRGVAAEPEQLLVTRGSQQALDLIARALLRPGDRVAVEALGYRPAWAALRAAGAQLLPIPLDAQGMRVDLLAAEAERAPLRAVYLTPHHQYPSTVTLSAARRQALLQLARDQQLALIEDDYDHEFHFDGPPVLPLASQDRTGQVLYVGTLSKILAPGLRLGFVWAPPPLPDTLAELRRLSDRQGDQVLEHAVAELLEEGEAERYIRRMTRVYRARRDSLVQALQAGGLDFHVPAGGMALWVPIPSSGVRWEQAARARGVAIRAGRWFTLDGADLPAARLFYAALPPESLVVAAQRLLEVLA